MNELYWPGIRISVFHLSCTWKVLSLYSLRFLSGYKDCSDGSDENATVCREYTCPEHTFRCSYGGCVHQEVVCDGVKDCVDGTDEDSSTCAAVDCEDQECSQYKCQLVD